jgi:DNA-binding transcriptional ArsR family regulator
MNADMRACSRRLPDDQVDLVVEVFRMLADTTRVQVLWALVSREMSVNDLAAHVGKPAPSVSQHLAKLRMARLVRTRREGTTIFYSLDNDHIGQLVTDAVFTPNMPDRACPAITEMPPNLRPCIPTPSSTPSRSRSKRREADHDPPGSLDIGNRGGRPRRSPWS